LHNAALTFVVYGIDPFIVVDLRRPRVLVSVVVGVVVVAVAVPVPVAVVNRFIGVHGVELQ
jgi:hypothetical protein